MFWKKEREKIKEMYMDILILFERINVIHRYLDVKPEMVVYSEPPREMKNWNNLLDRVDKLEKENRKLNKTIHLLMDELDENNCSIHIHEIGDKRYLQKWNHLLKYFNIEWVVSSKEGQFQKRKKK